MTFFLRLECNKIFNCFQEMNVTMSNHSKDISEQMDYQGKVLTYGPRAEKRTPEKSRINFFFLFYFYFSFLIFW